MTLRKPTGVYTLRLRKNTPPLVLWHWGGWVSVVVGLTGCLLILFLAALLNDLGIVRVQSSLSVFVYCILALPFFFTFQRTEFDNRTLSIHISAGLLGISFWRTEFPYAAVKGIGTDYRLVSMLANPRRHGWIDLCLYTRARRRFLLSRHWNEDSYREAIEHIREHANFPILRLE